VLEENASTEAAPIKVELVKNTSFEDADPYGKHELSINISAI
tara:strand:+ start:4880 stop:5005 length:126 start_codon:yes stop_codon:yes gene_type:complete